MSLFLHAADISNAAKPLTIQTKWAELVLLEFFSQGDREMELGLPISAGFDRRVTSLEMSQARPYALGCILGCVRASSRSCAAQLSCQSRQRHMSWDVASTHQPDARNVSWFAGEFF